MADRVEQETEFRIESGDKFVTFKADNRDELSRSAAIAARCLWDNLHPEDQQMRVDALKRQWNEQLATVRSING